MKSDALSGVSYLRLRFYPCLMVTNEFVRTVQKREHLLQGLYRASVSNTGVYWEKKAIILAIIGKKLLSFKPVVRTRRSYNRAGLIKQQKSFQGLAMYGHEVFDVLTKASKVIRDTLFE
jgi:hypothetical protein